MKRLVLVCLLLAVWVPGYADAGSFPYRDDTGNTIRIPPPGQLLVEARADGYRYTTEHPEGPPRDGQGRAWHDVQYDDSKWKTGVAPFGYGDAPRAKYGTGLTSNKGSYFFRKPFRIDRTALPPDRVVQLFIASDDAAVVYLNGKEVDRDPAFGRSGGHEFSYWNRQCDIPSRNLNDGLNVLAFELANPGSSSDAYLDAELRTGVSWLRQLDSLVDKQDLLFTFAQVSDTHGALRVDSVVPQLNRLAPDLVLFTGDLSGSGTTDEFEAVKRSLSKLDAPHYPTPGNHDVDTQPVEAYSRVLGRDTYYSFDHKGSHFVSLGPVKSGKHGGVLPEKRLEWLRNDLSSASDAKHVIVFSHFPIADISGGNALREVLKQHKVTAYLTGHLHRHRRTPFPDLNEITVTAMSTTLDGTPSGYRIYFVYPDRVVSFFKPTGGAVSPASKITALNPRVVAQSMVADSIREQSPFRFVVFGDNRTRHAIYQKIISLTRTEQPAFVVNVGDVIEQPGNRSQWDHFMKMSEPLMKTVPYYIAPGNHDISDEASEKIFREFVDHPGNELYYSFTHHGCRFIVLANTRQDFQTVQFEWLTSELAKSSEARHTFIFMHRPLFGETEPSSVVTAPGDSFRARFHRLCVKHRVDAVFTGHRHLYHSRMVDSVLYIITGGAGAPLHVNSHDEGGFEHLISVDVIGEAVRLRTIQLEPILERLQLYKE